MLYNYIYGFLYYILNAIQWSGPKYSTSIEYWVLHSIIRRIIVLSGTRYQVYHIRYDPWIVRGTRYSWHWRLCYDWHLPSPLSAFRPTHPLDKLTPRFGLLLPPSCPPPSSARERATVRGGAVSVEWSKLGTLAPSCFICSFCFLLWRSFEGYDTMFPGV